MMFKATAKIICLLALPVLATIGFNHAASADNLLTQVGQTLYPGTYIPLKRGHVVGGQPVIQSMLNGTQPATFMVDTGGGFCILSPEMAHRLHLKRKSSTVDDGTPYRFQGKQVSAVSVSTIKFGNLTITINRGDFRILDDQNFMLFPNKNSDDTLFDGIIGVNLLQQFAVLLDTSQNFLGLCSPGSLELNQLGPLGFTSVYIVPIFQKDGLWYVTVQLTNNGSSQSEDMVLDTGTNQTVISDTAATHLGLKIRDEQRTTNLYSNNVPVGDSSVDTLQIGGITLSGHAIGVAPVSDLEPPRLGMDILSGYRVLIDFPGKKMYLQPNTAAAVPAITVGPAPAPAVPPAK